MYPTASLRVSTPENIRRDIDYLTKAVADAQHKPYLKTQLVDSLTSLGYEREASQAAVEAYFRVSLQ